MSSQSSDSSSIGSLRTEGSPRHKHNNYSCYIHLINKTGCSLELVDSKAKSGHWAAKSPAPAIIANTDTLIELTDPRGPHGSEGWCVYRLHHPQRHNTVTFKLKFGDPYWAGEDNFLKASTQYPDWVKVDVLKYQNKGHPFVAYAEVSILHDGASHTHGNRNAALSEISRQSSDGRPVSKASSSDSSNHEVRANPVWGIEKDVAHDVKSLKLDENRVSVIEIHSHESDTETRKKVNVTDHAVLVVDDTNDDIVDTSKDTPKDIQGDVRYGSAELDNVHVDDDLAETLPVADNINATSQGVDSAESTKTDVSEKVEEAEPQLAPGTHDDDDVIEDNIVLVKREEERPDEVEEITVPQTAIAVERPITPTINNAADEGIRTETEVAGQDKQSSQLDEKTEENTVEDESKHSHITEPAVTPAATTQLLPKEALPEPSLNTDRSDVPELDTDKPTSKEISSSRSPSYLQWPALESQHAKLGIVALVFLTTYGITAIKVSGGLLRFVGATARR